MKKYIIAALVLLTSISLKAQDATQIFIKGGTAFGNHQNQTFSPAVSSGSGSLFQFGYSRQAKNLFRMQLGTSFENYSINTSYTQSSIIAPNLSIVWMKGIRNEGSNRLYLGAELEGSATIRSSLLLDNNGASILYNNTLAFVGRMEQALGETAWKFGAEASIGLLSWVNFSEGFAYSTPQEILESGEFSYDEDPTLKLYKYGQLAPIVKFNRIKTDISLFRDGRRLRWGIAYSWDLKAYEPFQGGQFVQGTHGITLVAGYKFGMKKDNSSRSKK